MKKIHFIRICYWCLVIFWMILIFILSNQDASESSQLSGGTIRKIVSLLLPGFKSYPALKQAEIVSGLQYFTRKSAHLTLYFILGLFSALAMSTYKIDLKMKALLALSICLAYSVFDEIHQLFVLGRSGEAKDVLIDFTGAFCGVLILLTIIIVKRKFTIMKEG